MSTASRAQITASEPKSAMILRPLAEAQATLCTACAKHFAWCKSEPTFASTSDAVVACTSFEAAMLVGWKCYFCDYRGNGQYDTFCGHCRRHK